MTGKMWVRRILAVFSAVVLILVILLTTIEWKAFDLDFFRAEYKKLDSAAVIGMSESDLMRTTEGLLDYIQGDRDNLSIVAEINGEDRAVFNQREITHMVDVQRLYAGSHTLRNAGIVVFLLLLGALRWVAGDKFLRSLAGGYLSGAVVLTGLLGVMALAISRDFLLFWNRFHMLFFTNDLWLLNPETDILIQIVPEQFFFDLVVRILVSFSLIVVGLGAISVAVLVRIRKARTL